MNSKKLFVDRCIQVFWYQSILNWKLEIRKSNGYNSGSVVFEWKNWKEKPGKPNNLLRMKCNEELQIQRSWRSVEIQ